MAETPEATSGRPAPPGRAGRARAASRRAWPGLLAAWLVLAPWPGGGPTHAQEQVRNFTDPILVLDTGGHHAPVRGLAFTPDGAGLLSAGGDKVVRSWGLAADPPGASRVIRPPIWRGPAGGINALALGPPDAQGQALLAVAGYGVESSRGNIGLYRFPGDPALPQGDLAGYLYGGGRREGRDVVGHTNTVACLAFDPRGVVLASGGTDGTVRLWDVRARAHLAVLAEPDQGAVRALAFLPGGDRLVSGGHDGALRVWDVRGRRLAARAPAFRPDPADPAGAAINCLAVSPDGRWVVVGREDGALLRYDATAPDLAAGVRPLRTGPAQGAVEAVAVGPGGRLAVSLLSRRLGDPGGRPSVGCDVELRSLPDGDDPTRVATSTNLVQALAFSPRGDALAFAGGDRQGVFLKDLGDPQRPIVELVGRGRTIWDVGFVRGDGAGGPAVAYSHEPPGAPAPAAYPGFDLRGRAWATYPADRVRRAVAAYEDWSVRPVGPFALAVLRGGQPRFRVELTDRDGRWWAHSFLPPGPGHDRPALAVACQGGVVVYRLEDGLRTRVLDGHGGAVYGLAPSEDGRWLATGSADQTVRLWTLAGCDELAPLGAEFDRRGDGVVVVAEVAPRGFAEAAGLRAGDVVEAFGLAGRIVAADVFLAGYATAPPNTRLELQVRRAVDPPPAAADAARSEVVLVGTSKRDGPALSLFVGQDREWVVWVPRGYYETSVLGDSELLGWHLNRSATIYRPEPTDFVAIQAYEAELRRPQVLDTLLETADPGRALGLVPEVARDAPALVRADAPPRLRVETPGRVPVQGRLVLDAPELEVVARVVPDDADADADAGARAVDSIRFLVDSHVQRSVAPGAGGAAAARLTVPPGAHRLSVVAAGATGRTRVETLELEYRPPAGAAVPAPARRPRLRVVAIGTGTFPGAPDLPEVPFAEADARALGAYLVDPAHHGYDLADPPVVLAGTEATAGAVLAALDALVAAGRAGEVGPGDTVVVAIETHVLVLDGAPHALGADAAGGLPPRPTVPAADLVERLGALADYGARVLVLLDGVHDAPEGPTGRVSRIDELTRGLYRRNVLTFVASIQGPGSRLASEGRGTFAHAVLTHRDADARTRLVDDLDRPVTLAGFRDVVTRSVDRLSGSRQVARLYVPGTFPARLPLFAPPAAAALAVRDAR